MELNQANENRIMKERKEERGRGKLKNIKEEAKAKIRRLIRWANKTRVRLQRWGEKNYKKN